MSSNEQLKEVIEFMQEFFVSFLFASEFCFVKINLVCLIKHLRHFKQVFNNFQLSPLFLEV